MAKAKIAERTKLEVEERIEALRFERAAALAEILQLEQQGAIAEEANTAADLDALASAKLDGLDEAPPDSRHDFSGKGTRLFRLRRQLDIVDRAIELGRQRAQREHGEIVHLRAAGAADEWRALHRRRALALIELLAANCEIETFKRSLMSGGMVPTLPVDGMTWKLFGTDPRVQQCGFMVREYLKSCERMGAIKKSEVQDYV